MHFARANDARTFEWSRLINAVFCASDRALDDVWTAPPAMADDSVLARASLNWEKGCLD
jgi:hypothetical protein